MYTIIIDDWGNISVYHTDNKDELVDIVLNSPAGAKVNINNKIIWDKAEEETTDEFWDFINQLKADDEFIELKNKLNKLKI